MHATAPGADILYVGARSCDSSDMGEAVAEIVDGHWADIVTNSYGFQGELLPAAVIDATVRVHTQAAIQGIGFVLRLRGCTATTATTRPTAARRRPPPSRRRRRWATAVGGTSLGIDAGGQVAVEQGWTTGVSTLDLASGTFLPGGKGDFLYGAGGGASRLFEQPSYQAGVVPNRIAESIGRAAAAGGARRRDGGGSEHGDADRSDPDLPRRASATTSTASGAPACRRRCSRA